MHGLGNDFVVARWPDGMPAPDAETVRRLGDRREGVGFDSLLLLSEPQRSGVAASYRVFNADGGESEQCGNGARCIASWLAQDGEQSVLLESKAGIIEAQVLGGGLVTVNLGEPGFEPSEVPFDAPRRCDRYALDIDGQSVEFAVVSMGNPHAVTLVESVDAAPVERVGSALGAHPAFPEGVNVGFMERIDANHIKLRVHERGVGETRACGTGAAAAVAVGRTWEILDDEVEVRLPGGVLKVNWRGPGNPLWQTGQTRRVYEGRVDI